MSFVSLWWILLPLLAGAQAAKKAPPVPVFLEPPQPFIKYIFPAGGQRGRPVDVTVTGNNLIILGDPLDNNSVFVSGNGVSGKVLDNNDPAKTRVRVSIEADADLGEHEMRLVTRGGVSNRFRFYVGQLPEINEVEPNSEKGKPQVLPALPVVVNGQITEGDRDYFRFKAKAGETLVLAVQARSIIPYIADAVPGWFDPCLTVFDAGGKEVKYADDFRLRPDPVMFFDPPKDGEYTVELRDIIYRGRGDFIYRMTIGAVPYITDVFPLGGQRKSEVQAQARGVNLPTDNLKVVVPDGGALRYVKLERNGIFSNAMPFAAGDTPEVLEKEPNDTLATAQRIEAPVTVNGRIEKSGDKDCYIFRAQAKQTLVLEVLARRLGSPLDSILTLMNARGDVLAENDDWTDPLEALLTHHADSRLTYAFPVAGDYIVRVRDVENNGGEEYAYRLIIAPPEPDFALRIIPDNARLGQGETTQITVNAVRKDGFAGDIALSVEGLPQGFVASQAVVQAGTNEARLTITAPPDAEVGVLSPAIVGTATIGKETVSHKAEAAEAVQQAFAYFHNVPTGQVALAVLHPAAFSLSASREPGKTVDVRQDTELPIVVKILRKQGAKGGVTLTAARPANGINVKSAFVAPDKDEGTVTISITKDARAGLRQDIIVTGVMKTGKETITRYIPTIPIQITQ